MSEVVLVNFPEFEGEIRAMADAIKGKPLLYAARAGAKEIATQAKLNVPKRSRELSRSIKVETASETATSATVVVDTNVAYAAMVEFGHHAPEAVKAHSRTVKEAFGRPLKSPVTVSVGAFVRQMNYAARPYLRPALDTTRDQVVATIRGALVDTLRRFAI